METENNSANKSADYNAHIIAWKASGLSKKKYCDQTGVNYMSLIYRIKKLEIETSGPTQKFIPVNFEGRDHSDSFATINFPNRCTVDLHQVVSASFLNDLISKCR